MINKNHTGSILDFIIYWRAPCLPQSSKYPLTSADVHVEVDDCSMNQLGHEILHELSRAHQAILLSGPAREDDRPPRPPAFIVDFLAENSYDLGHL